MTTAPITSLNDPINGGEYPVVDFEEIARHPESPEDGTGNAIVGIATVQLEEDWAARVPVIIYSDGAVLCGTDWHSNGYEWELREGDYHLVGWMDAADGKDASLYLFGLPRKGVFSAAHISGRA